MKGHPENFYREINKHIKEDYSNDVLLIKIFEAKITNKRYRLFSLLAVTTTLIIAIMNIMTLLILQMINNTKSFDSFLLLSNLFTIPLIIFAAAFIFFLFKTLNLDDNIIDELEGLYKAIDHNKNKD